MGLRHVIVLAAALTAVGTALFLYKWLVIGLPLTAGARAAAWDVEAQIRFSARGRPVKVSAFIPRDSAGMHVFDQRFVAPGYGLSASTAGPNRQVVLATRAAQGRQVIHIRFIVNRLATPEPAPRRVTARPEPAGLEGARLLAGQELLQAARSRSADERTLVAALMRAIAAPRPSDAVRELLGRAPTPARRVDAAVNVLSLAGIAARRVNGVDLAGPSKNVTFVSWLEALAGGRWTGFSAETGEPELPESYLPWWRGAQPLVSVEGARVPDLRVSFIELEEQTLDRILAQAGAGQSELVRFSLFGLPLGTQYVYKVLMVVPLGVFLLVILRNVIGIYSLGTFMPVLIALAFRETNLGWGLVLFTGIVSTGLLFRFYLERLNLLLVPRLAAVLIFVVLFMAASSVVTNQLGFERGISVALFPMVIMTMTIERVSVLWDERGPFQAILQALGALVIASLCYLVMTQPAIEYLFFTFPELHLLVLAATLMIGRYSGYRLLELERFRALAQGAR